MDLKVKKLTDTAKIPTRKGFDVGFDLYADKIEKIDKALIIHTGLAIEMPEGYWGLLADRSSMGKKGYNVHGGIIDNSYRGEIIVVLYNHKDEEIEINIGDKVVQLILLPYITPKIIETNELSNTDRNEKGFGSTGK